MKNYIVKLENIALEMDTLKKNATKENNIYIFYQEDSTISISTHLTLLSLADKTNVHYCDIIGENEFLMSLGMLIANCDISTEVYLGIGLNVDMPNFIKEKRIIIENKIENNNDKKEKEETSENKKTNKNVVVPTTKKRGRPRKNNSIEGQETLKIADTINNESNNMVVPITKKKGRPRKNNVVNK